MESKTRFRSISLLSLPVFIALLIGLSFLPKDSFTPEWTNYPESIPAADPRAVDLSGNVWFSYGYEDGVKVYDGVDWTFYTRENSDLVGNKVNEIKTDPVGNIWIATSEGMNVVHVGEWKTYTTQNSGLYSNQIEDIAIDPSGNVWIVTVEGLNVYDGENWRKTPLEDSGIFTKDLIDIDFDHSGNVWIICATDWYGRVTYYDGETWNTVKKTDSGTPRLFAYVLSIDPSGKIWIGAGDGINVFDGSTWKYYDEGNSGLLSDRIQSFAFEPSGKVWIGTLSGTSVFDTQAESTISNRILLLRNYLFSPESIWFTAIALGLIWLSLFDRNIFVLIGPLGWILTIILGPPSYEVPLHLAIMGTFVFGSIRAQVGGNKPGDEATKKRNALKGMITGLVIGLILAIGAMVFLWAAWLSM